MKKITGIAIAFALTFSVISCGESKQESVTVRSQTEQTEETNKNRDDGAVTSSPEFSDEAFAAVFDSYNRVKSSLVNSKAEEAGEAGADLVTSLEEVGADQELIDAAKQIAQQEDINQKRTAFREVSEDVSELLQGKFSSGEVYLQYCPMAFNGDGGSWLSTSKEIRNPYLPESMLTCGDVRDTLQ